MKKLCSFIAILGMGVMCSEPLFAVDVSGSISDAMGTHHDKQDDEPSKIMPALPTPVAPKPARQEVAIPALPPSLTCKPEWLNGVWELQHVYESPLGTESDAYNLNPVQYLYFDKDSRFYRFNAGHSPVPPQEVIRQMAEHSSALLQYILQDAGMLYLYQDRVATDTMVCFVVAETRPPYAAGNLLLMPPKGQGTGRLIKVYKKVWPKQNIQRQRTTRQRPPGVRVPAQPQQ